MHFRMKPAANSFSINSAVSWWPTRKLFLVYFLCLFCIHSPHRLDCAIRLFSLLSVLSRLLVLLSKSLASSTYIGTRGTLLDSHFPCIVSSQTRVVFVLAQDGGLDNLPHH